ncbi:MAG: galactose mutarotase [Clostridia bacterium]|nr:galactose mutarotase [Clostridia bacterium]
MAITKSLYGTLNEKDVNTYIIENKNGTQAHLIEKGATLDKLLIKDKNGMLTDILIGHDTLDGHVNRSDYQGVVVGQYANRIKDGKFSIDGTEYNVTLNEKGITSLHGGGEYSSAVWNTEILSDNAVKFTYFSPDGTEGFPGNVNVSVTYTLNDNDELELLYNAVSDKKTVINLTNHAYFNLNGTGSGDILNHILQINADRFTPIDEISIPTGELTPVVGTPFDFTQEKNIGRDIDEEHTQLKNGLGYDHNFCIANYDGTLKTAAIAKADKSGIVMTVKTDLPGIQLYTGNFFDGSIPGKNGIPMTKRCAFCLETQVFPDSPNHPEWPSCIYDAGETYSARTVFAFSK